MPIDRIQDPSPPKHERVTPLGKGFGRRLGGTRRARKLTGRELQDMSGVQQGTISNIETFARAMNPSVNVALALALALQVDVGWFISGFAPKGEWRPPKLSKNKLVFDLETTTAVCRAIAQRVYGMRQLLGLKKRQLDALAGLSPGSITRLENGDRTMNMSINKVHALAIALGCDLTWLITGIAPHAKYVPPKLKMAA